MTTVTTAAVTGTVTRYWKTGIIVTSTSLAGVTAEPPPPDPAGAPRQILPEGTVTGLDILRGQFLASMNVLADADGAEPVTDVTVHVEVWRNRYDLPSFAHRERYAGWTFLSATQPGHAESGCLNLTDPRAGSAMTAMPGLPWGRQFVILPHAGVHAVVPGWLTCSIVPLEPGQQIIAAVAVSAS